MKKYIFGFIIFSQMCATEKAIVAALSDDVLSACKQLENGMHDACLQQSFYFKPVFKGAFYPILKLERAAPDVESYKINLLDKGTSFGEKIVKEINGECYFLHRLPLKEK